MVAQYKGQGYMTIRHVWHLKMVFGFKFPSTGLCGVKNKVIHLLSLNSIEVIIPDARISSLKVKFLVLSSFVF